MSVVFLKFKFNVTAYITQQSYLRNTGTHRNCWNEALEEKRTGRLLFTYATEGGPESTSRCGCVAILPSQSSGSEHLQQMHLDRMLSRCSCDHRK